MVNEYHRQLTQDSGQHKRNITIAMLQLPTNRIDKMHDTLKELHIREPGKLELISKTAYNNWSKYMDGIYQDNPLGTFPLQFTTIS